MVAFAEASTLDAEISGIALDLRSDYVDKQIGGFDIIQASDNETARSEVAFFGEGN